MTLYFRSGTGWYAGDVRLQRAGRQTLTIPHKSFRPEGEPAGWATVDRIRISLWNEPHAVREDTAVTLLRLAVPRPDVVVLKPTVEKGDTSEDSKAALGVSTAERVASWLRSAGLPVETIDQQAILDGALQGRRLVILAYMPRVTGTTTDRLLAFVNDGGKLIACYRLPPALAQKLGFAGRRYLREERPGQFARMRLEAPDIAGLPETVEQHSWNIIAREPAAPDARVIGHWLDDRGRSTGEPAVLLSPRGAVITHLLTRSDRPAKQQLLTALAGQLVPPLWGQIAEGLLDGGTKIGGTKIGHTDGLAALGHFIESQHRQPAVDILAQAGRLRDEARAALRRDEYHKAARLAWQADQRLRTAYLRALDSPTVEGRAAWNHSGTGVYPGDWQRTADLLARAGMNMVLPNMLWGGLAHYPSDLLPRSRTFEQHGDQIAQCVEACHRRGIEVHVWKVNWNLHSAPHEFVDRMRQAGRTQVRADGKPLDWLCPSHPENFELERDSMLEVARRYPIDGLHFDYIRFPGADACYCDGCRRRFEQQTGLQVDRWPDDCRDGTLLRRYRQWRCEQITRLVAAVAQQARRVRPELKISAAVFPSYPWCRRTLGQDWLDWVEQGYVDFLCPMDYTNSDLQFASLVRRQLKLVAGRVPVYPGIGATSAQSRLGADRVAGQIHLGRQLGAGGFTIFDLSRQTAEPVIARLEQGPTARPARPPHRRP